MQPKTSDLLLLLDDDKVFLNRLERAMIKRGFATICSSSIAQAKEIVAGTKITHALLDLRLEDGNGLDIVDMLHSSQTQAKIVILTGYGAISTAVAAVKLGAVEYLSKPTSDADEIFNALMGIVAPPKQTSENPMSADRVRWEYIQTVYEKSGRNVSETARRLNMHRRTLQRILAKRAPNE